jgi:hypothetical protein
MHPPMDRIDKTKEDDELVSPEMRIQAQKLRRQADDIDTRAAKVQRFDDAVTTAGVGPGRKSKACEHTSLVSFSALFCSV